MKIYFAGSIRGGRDDKELYFAIIEALSAFGTVLTEHVGDKTLEASGEHHLSDTEIFERDMDWVRQADVIVAEVTTPSLGVGYELGQAQAMGKPVICLFRTGTDRRLSAMVSGNTYMQVFEYRSLEDVAEIFEKHLQS
jgi:nucleoside 2-deoxyribosyltransferase